MKGARLATHGGETRGIPPLAGKEGLHDSSAATIRLDAIANHLPAMIGYWNKELRCEFANDAYLEWFGLPPQSVIGLHLSELQGEKLFKLNEPHAHLALSGHEQKFEREIIKPDGSVGYTDARHIPDRDEFGMIRGFGYVPRERRVRFRSYYGFGWRCRSSNFGMLGGGSEVRHFITDRFSSAVPDE